MGFSYSLKDKTDEQNPKYYMPYMTYRKAKKLQNPYYAMITGFNNCRGA